MVDFYNAYFKRTKKISGDISIVLSDLCVGELAYTRIFFFFEKILFSLRILRV